MWNDTRVEFSISAGTSDTPSAQYEVSASTNVSSVEIMGSASSFLTAPEVPIVLKPGSGAMVFHFSVPLGTAPDTYPALLLLRDGRKLVSKPLNMHLEVTDPAHQETIPEGLVQPSSDRIVEVEDGSSYVTGQIVVLVSASADSVAVAERLSAPPDRFIYGLSEGHPTIIQMGVAASSIEDLLAVAEDVAADTEVLAASPEWLVTFGSTSPPYEWGDDRIALPPVWNAGVDGDGSIPVAVVDTGFDIGHPDLVDSVNPVLSMPIDPNRYPAKWRNHGTFVAGIIAAHHQFGVHGVMAEADLRVYSIESWTYSGSVTGDGISIFSGTLDGVRKAISDGARVVNMSFGNAYPDPLGYSATYAAWKHVITSALEEPGANDPLLVVSAMNDGRLVDGETLPAALSKDVDLGGRIVAVGAFQEDGAIWPGEDVPGGCGAPRANNGFCGSNYGISVEIAAPGVLVGSTEARASSSDLGEYGSATGTSFAAPFVTGLAGLVIDIVRICGGIEPGAQAIHDVIVDGANSSPLLAASSRFDSDSRLIPKVHAPTIVDLANQRLCPEILVAQSDGSTEVTEDGITDTYTITLNTQPLADVEITLDPDSQVTTDVPTVTFTPDNWSDPQTVEVAAVDDDVVEGGVAPSNGRNRAVPLHRRWEVARSGIGVSGPDIGRDRSDLGR